MDNVLHILCLMCQRIDFNLHDPSQCQLLRCEYATYCQSEIEDTWLHSQALQHYSTYSQLQESARNGCHLCTLLSTSISYPQSPERSKSNLGTAGVKIFVSRHVLQVAIEGLDMLVTLDMEDIPNGQCAGSGKEGVICKYQGADQERLFVVQSQVMRSYAKYNANKPEVIDSVTLVRSFDLSSLRMQGYRGLRYTNGDLFDVIRPEGHLWLARKHGDWSSSIGWIPKEHSVELIKPPHASCHCGKGVWEPTLLDRCHTAYADDIPDSESMVLQFLHWMSFCNDRHKHLRCTPLDPHLPLRIIDVGPSDGSQAPFLSVGKSRKGRYTTLSYRWGSGEHIKLTQDSFREMTTEIPIQDLPKTLRDGIKITRRLGLRYIWIDALCIIQDCEDDWLTQSGLMHQIYSDAWLNISADRAESAQAGFLQRRSPLSLRSCMIPNSLSKGFSNANSVVLPVQRGLLEDYLSGPFSRGWIFQERHFSRRILHFGEFKTIWECHYGAATETHPSMFAYAGPHIDHKKPNYHLETVSGIIFARCRAEEIFRILNDWYKTVALFSYTRFTNETDKLSAMSGLAKVHKNWLKQDADYFAGIWKVDFQNGLAWRNASVGCENFLPKTLQAESQSRGQIFAKDDIMAGRRRSHQAGYIAPSFSWASVNFPVHYSVRMKTDRDQSTNSHMIKLVSIHTYTKPQGDAFGQILDGWIRVRGLTILYSELLRVPQFRGRESDAKNLFLDNGHHNPDPATLPSNLTLLLLQLDHRNKRGVAGRWQAILLTPTGLCEDEYQRVGYYMVTEDSKSSDISYEEMGLSMSNASRPEVYTANYFAEWQENELKLI